MSATPPVDTGARLTLTHAGVRTKYEGRTRHGWATNIGNVADMMEDDR
jgi:hypothetical protein